MNRLADRRVNRTKEALRRALLELMTEQGYQAINTQDIVDRANVGRSTFYSHYADKDELLQENIAALGDYIRSQMRAEASASSHPALAFSLPTLQHVSEVRPMFAALLRAPGASVVEQYFQATLCELVREGLSPKRRANEIPPEVIAQFVVGAFWTVARWWILEAPKLSVAEVHRKYVALVSPSLTMH